MIGRQGTGIDPQENEFGAFVVLEKVSHGGRHRGEAAVEPDLKKRRGLITRRHDPAQVIAIKRERFFDQGGFMSPQGPHG